MNKNTYARVLLLLLLPLLCLATLYNTYTHVSVDPVDYVPPKAWRPRR